MQQTCKKYAKKYARYITKSAQYAKMGTFCKKMQKKM